MSQTIRYKHINIPSLEYKRFHYTSKDFQSPIYNESLTINVFKKVGSGGYKTFYEVRENPNIVVGIHKNALDSGSIKKIVPNINQTKKYIKDKINEFNGYNYQHSLTQDSILGEDYGIPKILEYGHLIPDIDPITRSPVQLSDNHVYSIPYVIMEKGGDRDLIGVFVEKKDDYNLLKNDFIRKKLFWNLLRSVQILHRNNKVHLDLKLEQFVCKIGEPYKVKLIDYGFISDIGKNNERSFGTPRFMSPHMYLYILGKIPFNYKPCVDIYSLGICFLTVILGQFPCRKYKFGCSEFVGELQKTFYSNNFREKFDNEPYKRSLYFMLMKMLLYYEKDGFPHFDYNCIYQNIDEVLKEDYFMKDEKFLEYIHHYDPSFFPDLIPIAEDPSTIYDLSKPMSVQEQVYADIATQRMLNTMRMGGAPKKSKIKSRRNKRKRTKRTKRKNNTKQKL